MDFLCFFELFEPFIRVKLAWDLLKLLEPAVSLLILKSPLDEAGDWIVPWYLSKGEQVPYDYTGARPLRLRQVATEMGALERQRQTLIDSLARHYGQQQEPLQFLMATYKVANAEIILDGNHRAVAASSANRECRILVARLEGPPGRQYLPDLLHWTTSGEG